MDFPNMSVKSFEKFAAVLPTQHCMIERDISALWDGEKKHLKASYFRYINSDIAEIDI